MKATNLFADYRQLLADSGLNEEESDRVVHFRAAQEKKFGTIRMKKDSDDAATVEIYETVGFDFWTGEGCTPKKMLEELEAMKPFNKLTVRINSPGGSVYDGLTILNILRRQDCKMVVEIEGIAASAASFIAQVADPGELHISEAGMLMVHRAMGGLMIFDNHKGIREEAIKLADVLEKIDGQIANIYATRSGRRQETFLKLMDEETWFTGEEAVEAKLADKTFATTRAAAMFDLSAFNYKKAPKPTNEAESTTVVSGDPAAPVASTEAVQPEAAPEAAPEAKSGPSADAVAVRLRVLELDAA